MAIWRGGIAIHGALLGGLLVTVLYCRWRRQSFWTLLDVLVPAVALGQAIGRWGNFFNSEAFGLPTDLPWKLTIPAQNRPIQFIDSETFHPTFLYESIWNFGVCALLLLLFRAASRGRIQLPAGALSCIYLMAYSSGRLWIEALRLDPLCLLSQPPFCEGGLRMAQLVSLLLIALGSLGLWWLFGQRRPLPDPGAIAGPSLP
jgi:phosphatidylglycerol:prolipoprotein diacylglycerol transferase